MNIATIRTAIYSWATANAGAAPVVWADQAAPRPALPYVLLRLNGPFRDLGADETRHTATEGVFDIIGHRRFTVSVNVFGLDMTATNQIAITLNNSLSKETVRSGLYTSNISVIDEGDIVNLSTYLDTKFQARFGFDASILALASTSDTLGSITSVELTSFGDTEIVG